MLSKKRNRRRYRKRSADSPREFKLCIRSLPPNLTEEQFISTLQENNVDVDSFQKSFYYVQGHYSSKVFKKQTLSRAYIQLDSFETIQSLSKTIRTSRFIDDLDNSMIPDLQISPFVKKWVGSNEVNPIQGTIQKDHVFQTFVKSWKLINEDETNSLQFRNLSVIAPLRKELEREEKMEQELNGRKQRALIELAGDPTSEEKKKRIKKIKRKLKLLEKKRKLKRTKAKNKNVLDEKDEKDVSKDKLAVEKSKKSKSKHKSKSKSKKPKTKSESKSSKSDTTTAKNSAATSEEKPKKKILLKPRKDDIPKPEMPADSELTKRARRKKSKKHKDKDKDVKNDLANKETKETPPKVSPKVKIKSKSATVEKMKLEKQKQENTKPEKSPSSESEKKAKSHRKSRKGKQSDESRHKDKLT